MNNRIHQILQELQPEMAAPGEEIWQHPETGYHEFETSRRVAEKLIALGLPVKTGLALTGVRADLDTGRPGPTVAVIGELDALLQPGHPQAKNGVAHSCGHHTHAAAMYGAAAVLSRPEILNELSGRIVFVAAPAEEGIELEYRRRLIKEGKIHLLSGKSELICEGVFDDVNIAFMNHIGGGYGVNDSNGYIRKRIAFTGVSCHGAYPQHGCNALNAMDLARHAIALLREAAAADDPSMRMHGIINGGGQAVNTLPGNVTMEYMLRSAEVDHLMHLSEQFDRAVRHAVAAMGAKAEIETYHGAMPLCNCDDLADIARQVVLELAPGAGFRYHTNRDFGSTDMGDVSQLMPVLHLNVPGCNGAAHKDNFAITDPVAAYAGNAEILAQMTAALLSDGAEKARQIIASFQPRMTKSEYLTAIKTIENNQKE